MCMKCVRVCVYVYSCVRARVHTQVSGSVCICMRMRAELLSRAGQFGLACWYSWQLNAEKRHTQTLKAEKKIP